MINVKPQILELLQQTGVEVVFSNPQNAETLPVISYFEASNIELARDGFDEVWTEVIFQIDVWAMQPSQCSTIAIQIDDILRNKGFKRQFSSDLFEQDTLIHHKTMRYRGVVDNRTYNIYQ